MFGAWKLRLFYSLMISMNGGFYRDGILHEILGKTGALNDSNIKHVIKYQYLCIALYTCADAYYWNR